MPNAKQRAKQRPDPRKGPPRKEPRRPNGDEETPTPEQEEGRPCPCQCAQVATITDRVMYKEREIYFNFKVRTACGIDRSRGPDGNPSPPVRKPFPFEFGSGLSPETKCYWTIKFWRDQADGEPQSDEVWIVYVEQYTGLNRPINRAVPERGAVQDGYIAPYGCDTAQLNVLIEMGDRQGSILNFTKFYAFQGCRPCLAPRQPGQGQDEFGG
ncbi:MAG: hypothetical protein HYX74_05935 [Acidobacteria bacterium]|nr:hypothetical protein [Acidobacteriota bacterium]